MISKELRQVIEDWYVLKTYGEVYENLHRDIQADIDHYFDATGQYGQVLSNNDWAALCKEWAKTKGYYLISGKSVSDGYKCFNEDFSLHNGNPCITEYKSEPEAVFKACQWILDNKEQ